MKEFNYLRNVDTLKRCVSRVAKADRLKNNTCLVFNRALKFGPDANIAGVYVGNGREFWAFGGQSDDFNLYDVDAVADMGILDEITDRNFDYMCSCITNRRFETEEGYGDDEYDY